MSIHFSNHYSVPPAVLYAAFTQQAFFERRYAETEVDEYTIRRFSKIINGFDIAIELNPPIHAPKGLPAAAKRLLPARQKILYTALWEKTGESSWSAEYCYDVQGKPIKIKGRRTINAITEGSANTVEFHVETKLPLFGRLLAEIVEARVKQELAADEQALGRYIQSISK